VNERKSGIITDKAGVRILKPYEFELLIRGIPKLENRTKFKMLMFTGMRYAEAKALYKNKDWFTGDGIKVPSTKKKAVQKERWVILTSQARTAVEYYLEGNSGLPHQVNWIDNLKRWANYAGIGDEGMSSKTTRKTWESWLIATNKDSLKVCVSQGHTQLTSLEYYVTIPFSNADKQAMAKYTEDWGEI